MVLPADRQGAQSALDGVGVEGNARVVEEALESVPMPQRVADRLAKRRAREDRLRREPSFDVRDHGARLGVAELAAQGQLLPGLRRIRPRLDLVPEPVLKHLQKGEYWFKVVPVDAKKFHDNYAKKFWDLTAANEGKYELDEATCGLKEKATGKNPEFVVGLPFPKVDPNDSQAGCKIAWNFTFAGSGAGGG